VRCRRCHAQVFAPRDACICGERCTAWVLADADDLSCPRCQGRLSRVSVEEGAVHVEQCARCMGCFTRTEDFSELVEREVAQKDVRLDAFTPPAEARVLPRQELLAETRCPYCSEVMERTRFAQTAAIVIDVCPKHGVWLDAGELPHLLDHVKHQAAGDAVPDEADRADKQHWDEVMTARANEEQVVYENLAKMAAHADAQRAGSVVAATAIGGPLLGVFAGMRRWRDWRYQ
jgi:Zn-finger nucleic acid-binding protein